MFTVKKYCVFKICDNYSQARGKFSFLQNPGRNLSNGEVYQLLMVATLFYKM